MGLGEEGQGVYEAALAAAMNSPNISAAFNTKHCFLVLVTQGQQVGHSSSRFQLGLAGLGCTGLHVPSLQDQAEERATVWGSVFS